MNSDYTSSYRKTILIFLRKDDTHLPQEYFLGYNILRYARETRKSRFKTEIFENMFVRFGYILYFCSQNNNVMRMVKTEMTWTFGAYMGQISNTIITPSLVTYCVSACALNFNEDEY